LRCIRCITCVLLLVCLLISLAAVTRAEGEQPFEAIPPGTEITGDTETQAAANSILEMFVVPQTGVFRVRDKRSGMDFLSNPHDFQDDPVAKSVSRSVLGSQLVIKCIDRLGNLVSFNSMSDVAAEQTLKVYTTTSGALLHYDFKKQGITVDVSLSLEQNQLNASVDLKTGITETGEFRLVQIDVLPYFGAAPAGSRGFILVPDGQGGVINFDNGRQVSQREGYTADVYGADPMIFNDKYPGNLEPVLYPVFGISHAAGTGYTAIITGGDSLGHISANVSGALSSYNNAYASFDVRPSDMVMLLSRTWASQEFYTASRNLIGEGKLNVRYVLMNNGSGLREMADVFSGYLAEIGVEDRDVNEYPVFTDVYAGVLRQKQFAGLVYTGYQPLTSFAQAEDIARDFHVSAPSVRMRVIGADSDGAYYGRITKSIQVKGVLGGKKGYQKLADYLKNNNGMLYYQAELAEYSKSSQGYSQYFDSAVSVTNKTIRLFEYKMSNLERRLDYPSRTLLLPEKIQKAGERLAKNIGGNFGVSLSSIAQSPYSSYARGNLIARETTKNTMTAALKSVSDKAPVLLERPSMYAFAYGDSFVHMPVSGDNKSIIDYNAPFLYMALRGKRYMAGSPINLASDTQLAVLENIECGLSPCFSFFAGDYKYVNGTPLESLYSGHYGNWKQETTGIYAEMAVTLKGLENTPITGYEYLTETLRCTLYADGTRIYVNRSDNDVTINIETGTHIVEAMNVFRVSKGGNPGE